MSVLGFSMLFLGTLLLFGTKIAAENISLTIESGDIFAFIGHNGAGKTTTIKCVVGIHQPTEGDVFINGLSIKTNPIECTPERCLRPGPWLCAERWRGRGSEDPVPLRPRLHRVQWH